MHFEKKLYLEAFTTALKAQTQIFIHFILESVYSARSVRVFEVLKSIDLRASMRILLYIRTTVWSLNA